MDDTPDAGGGGGGGSSYAIGSSVSIQNGVQSGNGKVLISSNPLFSGAVSDNLTEWRDEDGIAMSIIDTFGNLALNSNSAKGYTLYVNGSAYVTSGAWTASDLRFKENILPLNNSLDKILNIQPISFDWNKSGYPDMNFASSRQIGLVAQEVEKQIPELVHTDINGYKAVAYDKLTAVLVEAVKEQQVQMRNQQKKIEILELKLEELDNKK